MTPATAGDRIRPLTLPAGVAPAKGWVLDLSRRDDDERWALLDSEDRVRLSRLVEPARSRLLARRRLLADIATHHLGVGWAQLRFDRLDGRPRLRDSEGRSIHISTSSTETTGVVVWSPVPVGVDLERPGSIPEADDIATGLFHQHEANWVMEPGLSAETRQRRLVEVWVRKEAVVKLTGEGLQRDLRSFCVHPQLDRPGFGPWNIPELVTGDPALADVVTWPVFHPPFVMALAIRLNGSPGTSKLM